MTYSMISHNFNIIRLTARTNTAIPKFCHCCNDKAITAHIMKIALTRTACFFNSGWKFPPKTQKKQQWLFQSLLLKISVSYRNRTYNRVLGVDPIRWNQVQHSARKSLEIQGFSLFQILSGITLHKHFHRDFTPSNWLEISKAFDFRWTLQVQANSSM